MYVLCFGFSMFVSVKPLFVRVTSFGVMLVVVWVLG